MCLVAQPKGEFRGFKGSRDTRLALALRVPSGRITSILNGKRAISADTALRLARHFDTSARFWMSLPTRYDLALAERDHGARIAAQYLLYLQVAWL